MERKGFGPRFLAAFIDGIIVMLVCAIIGLITGVGFVLGYGGMGGGGTANPTISATTIRIFGIVTGLFGLAYTSMEIFFAATPGKMILKQKISRADGAPADQAMLIKRWAMKQSSSLARLLMVVTGILVLGYVSQLLGLVILVSCLMTMRDTKLALHDDLAGTSVMGPSTSVLPSGFPVMPPGSVTLPPPSSQG